MFSIRLLCSFPQIHLRYWAFSSQHHIIEAKKRRYSWNLCNKWKIGVLTCQYKHIKCLLYNFTDFPLSKYVRRLFVGMWGAWNRFYFAFSGAYFLFSVPFSYNNNQLNSHLLCEDMWEFTKLKWKLRQSSPTLFFLILLNSFGIFSLLHFSFKEKTVY